MTGEWIEPGRVIELRTRDVVLTVRESDSGGMRVTGQPVDQAHRLKRTTMIENIATGIGPDEISLGLEVS